MTNAIPYISQGDNLILIIDNESYTINSKTHMNYLKIVNAIRNKDWNAIGDLVDATRSLVNYTQGKLVIKDGEIFWDNELFHNALSKRLLAMYAQGFPIDSMLNLMENLLNNPSNRAVNELYGFLERNELPLTPDGCFYAYKKVKYATKDCTETGIVEGDLVDCYSGKNRNNIGDVITMVRNKVSDNPADTCSPGLHFASLEYLSSSHFGGIRNPIMIVKINPEDVVSIPNDYNCQKGRCCKYEVIAFHGNDECKEAFTQVVEEISDSAINDDDMLDNADDAVYNNNVTKNTGSKTDMSDRPGSNT